MVKEGNSLMCHHHTCKQKRAILVNSQKVADFKCEHLQKMQDCTTALNTFEKYQGGNISYPCDDNTRKSLCELATECEAMQIPIAVQVSPLIDSKYTDLNCVKSQYAHFIRNIINSIFTFLCIPCFDQIHLIGFYFVTCCFNIFTCIKTHTNSRRRAFARNVESICIG